MPENKGYYVGIGPHIDFHASKYVAPVFPVGIELSAGYKF